MFTANAMSPLITLFHPRAFVGDLPPEVVVRKPDDAGEVVTPWVAGGSANVDVTAVDWVSALDRFGDDDVETLVLATRTDDPVSMAWEILPGEWARWAVDPTLAAIVAVRRAGWSGGVDWWRTVRETEGRRTALVSSVEGSAAEGVMFPRLAPPSPPADRQWLHDAITAASGDTLRAGLLQLHDFVDASHDVAQEGGGPDGDYWHAIVHRREPDESNSKYWFRRVGEHPVFAELAPVAAPLLERVGASLDGGWDPFAFVDLCGRARREEGSPLDEAARRVQFAEMLLLLRHCAAEDVPNRRPT